MKTKLLTNCEKSLLFNQHKGIARTVAKGIARKYQADAGQVQDDAIAALGDLVTQWDVPGGFCYDAAKCKPSSWVWRKVYWSLMNIYQKEPARHPAPAQLTGEERLAEKPRNTWLQALLFQLSDDAHEVVDAVLATPAIKPARAFRAVSEKLSQQGWTPDRVQTAWSEVQTLMT